MHTLHHYCHAIATVLALGLAAPLTAAPEAPLPAPQSAEAKAVAELAQSLQIDATDIQIISQAAVTWRDASLGCPQPGMAYTQQLKRGYRLLLQAGGQRYHFHAGGDRKYFLCRQPQAPHVSE